MQSFVGLNHSLPPKPDCQDRVHRQTLNEGSNERIGRDGHLFLEYARRDDRTILSRAHFRNPLQVLPPLELDEGRCAYTQILNPCGGLVGGDWLKVEIQLGQGTHVLLSTPSATRVYRSLGETTIQTIQITMEPDTILEWLPETVIPFADSRFKQQLHVRLDGGATLFLWDAFSSGRVTRGERWAFTRLANEICVMMPDGRKVMERYDLDPTVMNLTAPGIAEGWDYFASLYIISTRPVNWAALQDSLIPILDRWPTCVMAGISSLSIPGLALRLVAKTAVDIARAQIALWDISRRFFLGAAAPPLRKY